MTRKGYYLKQTGRGTCPGLIVSVIVSDKTTEGEESDPRCKVRVFHKVDVAYSYHSRSGWTHPRAVRFGTAAAFWEWLHGRGKAGRRCYVFAPIASDALTLLEFWVRVGSGRRDGADDTGAVDEGFGPDDDRAGCRLRRLVANGRPDVIEYTIGGSSYLWLSGRQFWDYPDANLCRMFPAFAVGSLSGDVQSVSVVPRSADKAKAWLRAMTTFADWWASLGAGPFPRTVPGGAMQFLRSRMPKRLLVVHKDEEPYRLERSACHGGRASCWYFGTVVSPSRKTRKLGIRPDGISTGEIVGPVYRVDVRSMYPSLLRDRQYPVSLVKYSERWGVDDVKSLVRRYGVIADVGLQTDRPEYPYRSGHRVDYPVGRFRSVLCGPELGMALDEGAVTCVYRAAAYEMGRPFTAAAAELCELRQTYRDQGQTGWELLAKTLACSLAGKLAQNPRGWKEVPGASHYPAWDVWFCHDSDTGITRRFRCIAGRVYEYADIGVGNGTLTAGFAFLTSYGRASMRAYRECCPPFSVLSQDTDGLWLTAAGLASLRSSYAVPTSAAIGQLELKGYSLEGYWLGPKHYQTDSGWTLAGFHSPRPPTGMLIRDSYDVNPVRTGCTAPPCELRHFVRHSKLPKPPPSGYIDPDGWVAPVRLPELPGSVGPYHLPPPDDGPPD